MELFYVLERVCDRLIKSIQIRFVEVGGGGEIGSLAEFRPEGIAFDLGQRPSSGVLGDLGGVQGDAFVASIVRKVTFSVLGGLAPLRPVARFLFDFEKRVHVFRKKIVSVWVGRLREIVQLVDLRQDVSIFQRFLDLGVHQVPVRDLSSSLQVQNPTFVVCAHVWQKGENRRPSIL